MPSNTSFKIASALLCHTKRTSVVCLINCELAVEVRKVFATFLATKRDKRNNFDVLNFLSNLFILGELSRKITKRLQ